MIRARRGGRWPRKTAQVLLLPAFSLAVVFSDGFPWVMPRSFLVPGAMLLFAASVWWAFKRRGWVAFGAVLAAAIALVPPARACRSARAEGRGEVFMALAQMNVHQANTEFEGVVAAAHGSDADLLSLQEVDDRWYRALLDGLAAEYPWHLYVPGERNYGIALFSRVPWEKAEVIDLGGLPAIRAVVDRGGRQLVVISAHLRAPESAADWRQRNRQWQLLATVVRGETLPLCLIGDLNTVPWDEVFKTFESSTGMRHGPHACSPTWPTDIGIPLIPLDHLLTSAWCATGETWTFTIPGSDHFGLASQIFVH